MPTALDASEGSLDQSGLTFVNSIREHGWHQTQVHADDSGPGFAFSTGFWVSTKQPEVILFSMRSDIAQNVLWDLYRRAELRNPLPLGRRTDQVFANLPAYLFPVAKRHYPEYLGWSRWFYGGDDFPCLQIVWPDRAGLFPWEDRFDTRFAGDQIDLTESGWVMEIRQ